MVNSESLSDIFKDDSEKRTDKCSSIKFESGILLDSQEDFEEKFRISSEHIIATEQSYDGEVNSENCEGLSWNLHLSEELNNNRCNLNTKVESPSSDETYLSINTPSLSFEDDKNVVCNRFLCKNPNKNTPDVFDDSQETTNNYANQSSQSLEMKTEDTLSERTCTRFQEDILQKVKSSDFPQTWYSSDYKRVSRIPNIPEDEDIPHNFQSDSHDENTCDLQSSSSDFQDFPGPSASSTPYDFPSDCRELQAEWSSQELTQVARRLELRRKQAKRLIMTVIRKRQMAEETLEAFKKRLKKF